MRLKWAKWKNVNQFHATGPFLFLMKTSENPSIPHDNIRKPKVFLRFQGGIDFLMFSEYRK